VRASNANLSSGVRETLRAAGPGQEALVLFHSHGRERETYWGQRSHSIVSEDRDASGSDPGFDLDSIEPDLLEAKNRGVKVALVDLSCYSGSTQSLKGPACTVSLAASRYVSLCSGRKEERHFNARFFQLPPKGEALDLETQFLESRRADRDSINLPEISSRPTPAWLGWESFLVNVDPLDTFEDLKDLRTGTPMNDPKALPEEVDRWIASQPSDPGLKALREEIARKLAAVFELRRRLESQMPALAKDYDEASVTVQLPDRPELKIGRAYLAELLQAARDGRIPDGYTDVQRNLVKRIEPLQADLSAKFAKPLSEFQSRRDRFDQDNEAFAQAAGSLFESERELYGRQPEVPGSDPCREFAL
jgi:hypothetical protein